MSGAGLLRIKGDATRFGFLFKMARISSRVGDRRSFWNVAELELGVPLGTEMRVALIRFATIC